MEFNLMEIIQEYAIIPVAAVCVLLGYLLKNTWAAFPNQYIPLVLLPVSLVGVLWLNAWAVTPETVMAGVCSAALAVYAHQNVKHLGELIKPPEAVPEEEEKPGSDTQ